MSAHITGWITRGATTRAVPTPALPASREAVLQAVLHPSRLPGIPAVAARVAEVATRPNCTPSDVGTIIAGDPGFSAALLQAVNSAREGASARTVATVDRAVLVAGLNRVRLLALSLSLPAMRPQARYVPAAQAHSLASVGGAIFARELAVRLGRPEPEDDLNAALLRDLGVLLVQQTFPQAWAELATPSDPLDRECCARERAKFGVDHAEVGAEVLKRWGLPDDIAEPIRHHHHPDLLADTPHFARAELLWFADLLTRLDTVAEHPTALDRVLSIAARRFRLDVADLADFLGAVRPKIDQFAEALNRDIGRCPNYAARLLAATDELHRLSPARV
jgi:HD-like signal output (HDOD) protein